MIKELEHLIYEERVREQEQFSLGKQSLRGILSICTSTWREGIKRMEACSLQWCPVTGEEAMSANLQFQSEHRTPRSILLCRWLSTGTGYSKRLWGLPLLRSSEDIWTWSRATGSRWPCLSRKIGAGGFQRSFPTSVMLWFCGNSEALILIFDNSWNTGKVPDDGKKTHAVTILKTLIRDHPSDISLGQETRMAGKDCQWGIRDGN